MAKDRNTFAKRQREMDRKHKAAQKRLHRVKKKQDASRPSGPGPGPVGEQQPAAPADPSLALSPAQQAVLTVFRRFRMTQGHMLCFSRADEDSFRTPLTELAEGGFLVTERFSGGYSLTPTGFAAMQAMA